MWLFSCFKHDPSKDHIKNAKEISRHAEEDHKVRQRIEEDELINIEKAKEESLKSAEEEEKKRRLEEETKEKGKRKQSKDPSLSKCNACKNEIEDGMSVNAFGVVWHPQCLCCLHCHKPIAIHEISKSKGQYHKPCYKKHNHQNCYVCEKKIPLTEEGRKYCEHPYWKEKYCPFHDDDGTAKCYSCERLESCGTKYVMVEDGRWLCRECMECAVMDTDECHVLHLELRDFFESLNMKIDKEFHLLLVEKEALNKAEKEEKIDNHYGKLTRGICLSEVQKVTSVTKGPRMGPNMQLTGMARESHWVVRKCEVTAILILYGLPRSLTGSILAHEMMHAWLRINGYRDLNIVLEEGLCQVLSLMWLEPQTYAAPDATADSSSAPSSSRTPPASTTSKKDGPSDFEKRLVEFYKYQIETDDSEVYGLGFKKVNEMMSTNSYNLKDTLKDIVRLSKTTQDSQI